MVPFLALLEQRAGKSQRCIDTIAKRAEHTRPRTDAEPGRWQQHFLYPLVREERKFITTTTKRGRRLMTQITLLDLRSRANSPAVEERELRNMHVDAKVKAHFKEVITTGRGAEEVTGEEEGSEAR